MTILIHIHPKMRILSLSATDTVGENILWPVAGHRAVESTSCQHTTNSREMKSKLTVKHSDKPPVLTPLQASQAFCPQTCTLRRTRQQRPPANHIVRLDLCVLLEVKAVNQQTASGSHREAYLWANQETEILNRA